MSDEQVFKSLGETEAEQYLYRITRASGGGRRAGQRHLTPRL
jgi:hypothetical protein